MREKVILTQINNLEKPVKLKKSYKRKKQTEYLLQIGNIIIKLIALITSSVNLVHLLS